MPEPAVALNCLQAFEIPLNLSSQVTFDQQSARVDRVDDIAQLFRCQIFGSQVGVDIRLLENLFCCSGPQAVNVGQRSFNSLLSRYLHSK
jgi:hypothetical protein